MITSRTCKTVQIITKQNLEKKKQVYNDMEGQSNIWIRPH